MKLLRNLHRRLVGRVQPGRAHAACPAGDVLTERDAAEILLRVARAWWRGLRLRPFLASHEGRWFVAPDAVLTHTGRLSVGRDVKIEALAEVHALARRGVRLGHGVTIGRGACLRPSSYYGTDLGEGLTIGAGSAVGPYAWIGASGFVEIGANVLLGPRVVVIPENHNFDDPTRPIREQGVARAGVVIEDDCWLGADVKVLAGVRIGRGAVVAAGAVVHRDVAAFTVVGGVPARPLRTRGERAQERAA